MAGMRPFPPCATIALRLLNVRPCLAAISRVAEESACKANSVSGTPSISRQKAPDLRGRTPIHVGSGHTLGERGGEQAHTLSIAEVPTHAHLLQASGSDADQPAAGGRLLARTLDNTYGNPANLVTMNPGSVANVGGSQAHLNMQPFLTLSFCIALQGIFPSPT